MSKSLNMSEYQKVIFVNNIDEGMLEASAISMQELSEKYPFAVFFTNDTTREHAGNIWSNGERLTRFIDIDEDHNTIQIGEHQLVLRYNHNTGKIGIYDANPLKLIEIESISFIDAFTGEYVKLNAKNVTIDHIFDVNPKDNLFTMSIRFDIDETANDADVNTVNKEVKVYENGGTTEDVLLQNFSPMATSSKLSQLVDFKYLVTVPSLNEEQTNMHENEYKFVSLYVSSATDELKMKVYKNPVSYSFDYAYTQQNTPHTATSIEDRTTIYAESDDSPKIYIHINEPSNITSYDNAQIIAKISVDNDLVTFDGNSTSTECTVLGNEISFTNINVGFVEMNSEEKVTYTIEFYREDNGTRTKYIGLTKTFSVIYAGLDITDLYYVGYNNPLSNDFSINEFKAIKETRVYDWHDTAIVSINDKKFYIAVPANSTMCPRLDLYNNHEHIKNENAFNMSTTVKSIGKNDIEFRVYEARTFYGKYIGIVE